MPEPRKTRLFALLLAVGVALPWLWFAWLTRPGTPRPLVADVLWPFVMMTPWPIQSAVEWAIKERRYGLTAFGLVLTLLSVAAISYRVRSAFTFGLLLAFMIFIALVTYVAEQMFRPKREPST